ncbi:MAG: acyltransferase domain-containing protein [Actinobacteria bacterium]|uniref:[acyl-carrier-protein] S-malonyltransferase n=1 Tax=freshwater metagenome TaxID=449393 RepID=A0A6J6PNW0_9ZZZZ|nr:acyltransferase domain-containing protein [Actinomycetota bacterium]
MLALLAPGQGSQTPGFLSPWLEDQKAAQVIGIWSDAIGLDLTRLGTSASADEIRDTANAQPLLVAGGLIGALRLFGEDLSPISYVAGHSVGEITAAAFAGTLDSVSAMKLVHTRGAQMALAAKDSNTGMSAVLGGERDVVVAAIIKAGLTPANENGGGQIVAAGSLTALATFAENPPEGSRVRALAVSGAFHTSTMAPAVAHLATLATSLNVGEPKIPFISNKDGAVIEDGREILDRIVGQIAGPVRWDLCMETMAKCGVTGVIEVPPAGTLAGLVKRAQSEIETFTLKAPEDLEAAAAFIAKHGGN